ncbi:MAG: lamin tail domain-containing protein, partial [Candidatus Cloacimonetes bacterium]|nr:lamin tail domain-containing protein [Candidatus Cloacimonadota bacterium]
MKKGIIFLMFLLLTASLAFGQVLTEGFETWPPAGWTLESATEDQWVQDDGTDHGPDAAYAGTYAAMYNNYDYSSGTTGSMTTPAFDVSTVPNAQVSFYWWNDDSSYNPATIEILSSTDGTNFTSIEILEVYASAGWMLYANPIAADVTHIQLIATSDYGLDNTFVDEFVIGEGFVYGTVAGTVTLDGGTGNVEEVVVTAGAETTNPAADGTYSMEIVTGTYELAAALEFYETATVADVVVTEGNTTTVDVTLTALPLPDNDTCETAEVTGDVTDYPFNTTMATTSGFDTNSINQDIWYSYTPVSDGTVTVDLCGSTFDTKLAVYGACDVATELGYNDDSAYCNTRNAQSAIEDIAVVGGEDYMIQVGGYGTNAGEGDLTIVFTSSFVPEPPTDLFVTEEAYATWEAPPTAIYTDDLESYTVGDYLAVQSADWTTWSNAPGTGEDALISNVQALSGSNSVVVEGTSDLVLLMDNYTSGVYSMELNLFVPTGHSGYWNLQKTNTIGQEWAFQILFETDGIATADAGAAAALTFPFDFDTWINMELVIDLDADWCEIWVDGTLMFEYQWTLGCFGTPGLLSLGGMNLFASGGSPMCYFDDFTFSEISSDTRALIGYNTYIDGVFDGFTTELFYQYLGLIDGTTYLAGVTALYDEGESASIDYSFTYVEGTPPEAPDVFFSEYIEGSSNNKALEIYNNTGAVINLDDFRINQSNNGGGWEYLHYFPVSATLADGDVWVILNDGTDPLLYDPLDADEVLGYPSVVHHNGNDARGIEWTPDGGTTWELIDVFGVPTEDIYWDVAGVFEAAHEYTLVRKDDVVTGNTDWALSAGTNADDSEWVVYPQDTFDYLGEHPSVPIVLNPPTNLFVDEFGYATWEAPQGGGTSEWLIYDTDVVGFSGIGAEALDYSLIWASKWVPADLTAYDTGYVTKVAVNQYTDPTGVDYVTEVRVMSGDGMTVLYTQDVTGTLTIG